MTTWFSLGKTDAFVPNFPGRPGAGPAILPSIPPTARFLRQHATAAVDARARTFSNRSKRIRSSRPGLADPAPVTRSSHSRSRFADAPEPLIEWVRQIPPGLSGRSRYVMAAGLVLAHFLGSDPLEDKGGPFAKTGESEAQKQAVSRLLTIAEALLLLHPHQGFAGMCAMLRRRGLAESFFELSISRRLADGGYEIIEAGTRAASDCDALVVAKEQERLAVRMFGLAAPCFSAPAVRSALDKASTDVSTDLPVFLACFYPQRWNLDCWDIDFSLGSVAEEYLSGARTVNRLGFYRESFTAIGEGGAHSLDGFVERNPNPRVPSTAFDDIFGGAGAETAGSAEQAGGAVAPLNFIEWVDWVLAPGA